MKSLTDFRTAGRHVYAPSPLRAGLCLIGLGLALIGGYVRKLPRRLFFMVQAGLVWQVYGVRNYTHQQAKIAWATTGFLFMMAFGAGCLIHAYCLYVGYESLP